MRNSETDLPDDKAVGVPTKRAEVKVWWAILFAVPVAFLIMAFGETIRVPTVAFASQPNLWPAVFWHSLVGCLGALSVPILLQLGLSMIDLVPERIRRYWIRVYLVLAVSIGASVHAYVILVHYQPFRYYVPFILMYLLFAAALFIGYWSLVRGSRGRHGKYRWKAIVPTIVSIAGFALAYNLNYTEFKGQYPTLHLSCLLISYLLLHIGMAHILLHTLKRTAKLRRLILTGIVVVATGLPVAAIAMGSKNLDTARPIFASFTVTGRSTIIDQSYNFSGEDSMAIPIPDDPEALDHFNKHLSPLDLPDEFQLDDFNVVLITVEALRFDQTSFGNKELETTPNMAAFVRRGANLFERAYSPSSGTLHAMASLMSMTYPSHVSMTTWAKAWYGELDKEVVTAAELFEKIGYDTFWVSHNHKCSFTHDILGLDQGFKNTSFVQEWGEDDDQFTDRKLANLAIQAFKDREKYQGKFFSWIFLASPHSPYLARYPDWPAETEIERYRQEVHFADSQVGRILDELERGGLLEKSIVIILGDHGEEFGDHGGNYHKSTVYTEVVNVPLIVWIPGLKGKTIKQPVSSMYTFLWLFLQSSKPGREFAEMRVRKHIGPMLRATDDAVIVELVGHDRMMSSLIYEDYKINYDFISQRHEVFHLASDPGEKKNLLFFSPDIAPKYVEKIKKYRQVRAAHRKIKLDIDREAPLIDEEYLYTPAREIPPPEAISPDHTPAPNAK